MEQIVDRFIEKHRLLKAGSTVVVGVSGGPDSMALLLYFLKRQAKWKLKIVACHVNHMLRGEQSKEDFEYVKQFCRNRNILFEGTHVDVNEYKKKHHMTTQTAARACRYQFFARVMEKYDADFLALAHHGDDQVETMLMRQTLGSLGFSRAGIPVKRLFATGMIIRPFLCVEKTAIEQYIEQAGIVPRQDPSNESAEYVRNRFRRVVLPFLKQENPKVHEKFQQQSEWLTEDETFLMALAEQKFHELVQRKEDREFIVDASRFQSVAIPLQRRIIQLILNYLYRFEYTDVTYVHIEQILQLFHTKHSSKMLQLPANVQVIRSYDHVTFTDRIIDKTASRFFHQVDLPFHLELPNGVMTGEVVAQLPETKGRNVFVGDVDEIKLPLTIRSREAGDKMYPLGMQGSKKVKDIFIDEKIDRKKRDVIPLVEDANGNILWIAGVKRAKFGLVSDETQKYVYIAYQAHDGEDFRFDGNGK